MNNLYSTQKSTIFQWYLLVFTLTSLISFCVALVPLFSYLQSTFSELQTEKAGQQLNIGATKLEDTVVGVLNAANTLAEDPRFLSLRYHDPDYTGIPANVRNQIKSTFHGLLYPLELISDAALMLDENVVVTQNTIFVKETSTCYYPDFFCVDDMNYEEWETLLSSQRSGFFPAHRITTKEKDYDALIYATKWGSSAYLYACMDINDIKNLMIADYNYDNYYFTITDISGNILYSDLPADNTANYQTLGQNIAFNGLSITMYITDDIFFVKMKPLYLFLGVYCSICVVMLILVILTGTRISSKPVFRILHALDSSGNIPDPNLLQQDDTMLTTDLQLSESYLTTGLYSGFAYIFDRILSADTTLGQYKSMLNTQQKMLQARFMEKAITGQLTSPKDAAMFHSYFPEFPDTYCLLLLRLQMDVDPDGTVYTDPLSLLQSFIASELPLAYQQQLDNSELLLIFSEDDFNEYIKVMDFIITNINQEEPSYDIRCVSGRFFKHIENLPVAYRQVMDLIEFHFPYSMQRVCSFSDCTENPLERQQALPVTMTDLFSLYTAINYGNDVLALEKLQTYSEELDQIQNSTLNRRIHETLCTFLAFIKLEHPLLLMDLNIPGYRINDNQNPDNSLYAQLCNTVSDCCYLIQKNLRTEKSPLVSDLIAYIDSHYTDYDLCFDTLEEHFHCSASTMRKAFKSATNITISHYIEQKRMAHARELLSQKDKSIAMIASECGYTTPNSFYKAYKRVYGYAPTQGTP